jgi:hypothetical protein
LLEIKGHSTDHALDARLKREREVSELQRLIARRAQLQDTSDLDRAIADRKNAISKIDREILELENQKNRA